MNYKTFYFLLCFVTFFLSNTYADIPSNAKTNSPRGNIGSGLAPLPKSQTTVLNDYPWEAFGKPLEQQPFTDPASGEKWSLFQDQQGHRWGVNAQGKFVLLNQAQSNPTTNPTQQGYYSAYGEQTGSPQGGYPKQQQQVGPQPGYYNAYGQQGGSPQQGYPGQQQQMSPQPGYYNAYGQQRGSPQQGYSGQQAGTFQGYPVQQQQAAQEYPNQ